MRPSIVAAVGVVLALAPGRVRDRGELAPRSAAKPHYAYAGVDGPDGARGVRASVTLLERPRVPTPGAHVAAWVGVAGKVAGKLHWLQVGVATEAAAVTSGDFLYCEHQTPSVYESRIVLRSKRQMRAVVARAPRGFGEKPEEYRYDVIFLKEPLTADAALDALAPREGVDEASAGPGALYVSRFIPRASESRLARIAAHLAVTTVTCSVVVFHVSA